MPRLSPSPASGLSTACRTYSRKKFANVNVVIADQDYRTAQLVRSVLKNFGFERVHLAVSEADVRNHLENNPIDLLITEQRLSEGSGLSLLQTIRRNHYALAIRPDLPVMMLTGFTAQPYVEMARDAGINEFLAKPFTVKTLSQRLIEMIDRPRQFVHTKEYKGPSRRRKQALPEGVEDRRVSDAKAKGDVVLTPPNTQLKDQLHGLHAADIITDKAVAQAQETLLKAEQLFRYWVREGLDTLETAYQQIQIDGTSAVPKRMLMDTAYSIKSQAGLFEYTLASHVAHSMIPYVEHHSLVTDESLIVIRKHIDTLGSIFRQEVKDPDSELGQSLLQSLERLRAVS